MVYDSTMGKKILLVEADQNWRQMVTEALEDAGVRGIVFGVSRNSWSGP